MDTSSPTSAAKRQKGNTYNCIKSLDDFPDDILKHLLSFLPTKCAVGTSTFSRRWRYLWMHLPNLDFHEGSPAERLQFMNFTERVLVLSCNVRSDTARINTWITSGVMRNAQEFDICLDDVIGMWVLPHCLFRCETMIVLKLAFPNILKPPSDTCLSNLKILTLENVTFSDELSTNLLFSGLVVEDITLKRVTSSRGCLRTLIFCGPELARLVIDNCNLGDIFSISISAPKLWRLTLQDSDENQTLGESRHFGVLITAPNVRVLNYYGKGKYWICGAHSLVMASIDIPSICKNPKEVAENVFFLLKWLIHVNHIKLSINVIEVLAHASDRLDVMPNFDVTLLEFGPEPVDLSSEVVEKILLKCCHLERIINVEDIFAYDVKKKKLGILNSSSLLHVPTRSNAVYSFN